MLTWLHIISYVYFKKQTSIYSMKYCMSYWSKIVFSYVAHLRNLLFAIPATIDVPFPYGAMVVTRLATNYINSFHVLAECQTDWDDLRSINCLLRRHQDCINDIPIRWGTMSLKALIHCKDAVCIFKGSGHSYSLWSSSKLRQIRNESRCGNADQWGQTSLKSLMSHVL